MKFRIGRFCGLILIEENKYSFITEGRGLFYSNSPLPSIHSF